MKILFYINQIYEGGAERVITQLASSFADTGHESILVTSFEHSDEYDFSRKVRRFSLEGKQLEQSRIKRNVSRIQKLRKILKGEAPDIVLSFMMEPNFRALISSFGLPCKNIVSVRNDPNREYSGKVGSFVGKVLMPLLADGCVFQTKQASEWFPERLREKSSVIPNEVAHVFFETERSGEENYWVAIGRLTSQKNYPMMIKAFAEVIKSHPEQKLKIYGAGAQHKELENLIFRLGLSTSVSLEGQTHDVPSVLSSAIGFLMTSDYEGMPNALMEAMAMGLPCIATDCPCGGPAELIVDGENGFLIATGDEAALSGRVNSVVENHSIVTLSFLAQCMMSILLGRPDQARARPSTLLSDEVQYKKIFGQDGNLEAYYRAASLGKQVCLKFPQIKRDLEGSQISDIRFYVIMGVASMLSNKDSLTFGDIENLDLDKLSDEIIQTVADMVMDVYLALGGTSKAAKSYAMASKVKEKISLLLP